MGFEVGVVDWSPSPEAAAAKAARGTLPEEGAEGGGEKSAMISFVVVFYTLKSNFRRMIPDKLATRIMLLGLTTEYLAML